jgi:flavin-dependent dehydrogenase
MSRHHRDRARKTLGYFLNPKALVASLTAAVQKAGAARRKLPLNPVIELHEEFVRLRTARRNTQARLLLIAQGQYSRYNSALGMPGRVAAASSLTVAGLDAPRKRPAESDGVLHVVEMPERSELGLFFLHGATAHLRLVSSSSAVGTRTQELTELAAALQTGGLLDGVQLERARGAVWTPPAGIALELETHVAKRCCLIGTAGGFADSTTGQTLGPTILSAVLAATMAENALAADPEQPTLTEFDHAWQASLATWLRPPSTPLRMLLPLLFANERIVGRFSHTLLHGEPA